MEMRSEDRESAGLQDGPAQVPRIERHTCGQNLSSKFLHFLWWYASFFFHLASLVEVGIEPDSVVASSEQFDPEEDKCVESRLNIFVFTWAD